MSRAHLSLLCVLIPTLASCASLRTQPPAYVPPRIDCAANDIPRAQKPEAPALTEKSVVIWQLWGWGWQAYAEDVLMQRVETAHCLKDLKDKQVIR